MRANPTRRIYHETDRTPTYPDYKLPAAFEHTKPGVVFSSFEDDVTGQWVIPAIGLLVGGFFLGRWWARRPKEAKPPTTLVGNYQRGMDLLGAEWV